MDVKVRVTTTKRTEIEFDEQDIIELIMQKAKELSGCTRGDVEFSYSSSFLSGATFTMVEETTK